MYMYRSKKVNYLALNLYLLSRTVRMFQCKELKENFFCTSVSSKSGKLSEKGFFVTSHHWLLKHF